MRGNNLPEIRLVAFGDWIHSYLSPRQSVDSNPSPGVASSTIAAFPVASCNPDLPLLPSPQRRRHPTPAAFSRDEEERETAKSHGNFKHRRFVSALSSAAVLFHRPPWPPWTPLPSRSSRSFLLPLDPPAIGTEERQRASHRCGYLVQCGYS